MKKLILIDNRDGITRVALLENDRLAEYFTVGASCTGNIYLGKVNNMIKGNKTAFIDIGTDKNALLTCESGEVYCPGSLIVVQATREPIGDKGAKVSADITLQGTLAVLTPQTPTIGVSKKIDDPILRESLKASASAILPDGVGCILRTESASATSEALADELNALVARWREIERCSHNSLKPVLLHSAEDGLDSYIKEKLVDDCTVKTNDKALYDKLSVQYGDCIAYSDSGAQFFGLYRIERDLKQASQRKVWLDDGAYIVFDRTEAMTVIDVNSGKATGSGTTALKVNLEAADEIVRQVRLRNLAGIIIIDFINMNGKHDEDALLAHLTECFKADRSPTCIYGFTRLGLIEMSRKRLGKPLNEYLE